MLVHNAIKWLLVTFAAVLAPISGVMAANPIRAAFDAGTTLATGDNPFGVVVADLRGIARSDIVVANSEDDTVSVFLSNGDGTFAPKQDFASCPFPTSLATADLDKDNAVDLIVVCDAFPTEAASSIGIMIGNGDGTFQAPVDYSLEIIPGGGGIPEPYGTRKVLAADLDGDTYPDVVAQGTRNGLESTGGARVLMNSGAAAPGTLEPVFRGDHNESMHDFALVDLDGDQILDIAYAVHNTTDERHGLAWATGDGTGHFVNEQFTNMDSHCEEVPNGCNIINSVAVGDLNGDHSPDLVFSGDLGPCVMLRNGTSFTPCSFQSQLSYVRGRIALSDLTGRGQLDLVSVTPRRIAQNPQWVVSVLIGSDDATFAEGPVLFEGSVGAGMQGFAIGDFNVDGLKDIVASFAGNDEIRVWLNVGVEDQSPTADDVSLSTLQDESVDGALEGDQSQGAAITYEIVEGPNHGTLELTDSSTGEISYTPEAGYFGSDTFTYRVNDGYVDSNVATATIDVHSKPVAEDDSISTTEGEEVAGTLEGSDPGDNPLTFEIETNGTKGTATITDAATGEFTYTPDAGETGQDTFTFTVSNGFATATATETIIIGADDEGDDDGGGGGGSSDLLTLGALLALLIVRRRLSY